uniref:Uncharacterized protein n=1 Tax=Arundo donax TaxID=35708 RepID=A0A0A9HAJ2_ARUDO
MYRAIGHETLPAFPCYVESVLPAKFVLAIS